MARYRILEGVWFVPNPDDNSGDLGEGTRGARVQKGPGDIIELEKEPSEVNAHKLQLLATERENRNVNLTEDTPAQTSSGKALNKAGEKAPSDKPPTDPIPTGKGIKNE